MSQNRSKCEVLHSKNCIPRRSGQWAMHATGLSLNSVIHVDEFSPTDSINERVTFCQVHAAYDC